MRSLVGVGSLARLIVRRDRIRLAVWVVVLAAMPAIVASSFADLYSDDASRRELVATVSANPGLVALMGPVHGSSVGALTAWRIGPIGALLVALMAVLTVIRHTRDEEETGRRELLGSTVLGRHAPLAAAVLVTAGVGLAIGVLAAGGLLATGQPAGGAVALGLGWWLVAVAFAAVGALAAQLTEGSGAARGVGVSLVGVALLLRMAGDGSGRGGLSWLVWASPIGWFTSLRAFAGERWWVLGLLAVLAAAVLVAAFGLSSRRDVGAGVLRPRNGPRSAGPSLGSSLGLAWRIQRPALVGWSVGLAAVAAVYGGLAESVGQLLDDNPQLAELFERLGGGQQLLTDAFFSAALSVIGLLVGAFAISSVLRLRAEEESLRADWVLATATPRLRWAASHLLFAVAGPVALLALAGLVAGVVYGLVVGDTTAELTRLLRAALLHAPAVWVVAGMAAALFGLVPRSAVSAWAALVAFLLVGLLGPMLQVPQWVMDLSPFTHVPPMPEVAVVPLLWLTAVAATLIGAGLVGFNRRDLT